MNKGNPSISVNKILSRQEYILNKSQKKNVLHIGCTDFPYTEKRIIKGELLHQKITDVSNNCVGIDLSEEGVSICKQHGLDNIVIADAEKLSKYGLGKFEIIIAGEVLEHVNNPGLFLSESKKSLDDGGLLVITVPNAFFVVRIVRLLFGKEDVHPDHVAYYSEKTLLELLRRYGYACTEIGYDFEFGSSFLKKICKFPLWLLYKLRPSFGQSLIVVAKASL